jgi:lipid II isoglutaminyl synthase (glutamine-hydrolysing)
MTERAGRHAAARVPAETLIPPAQPRLRGDGASPPEPSARPAAGGHVNGNGRVGAARPDAAASIRHPAGAERPGVAPAADERPWSAGGASKLRIVWVYPDLLSTYGDRGNLLVLSRRARLRGIEVEANEVNSDERVPAYGDIYLLGGGEDLPQILAAKRLSNDGGLATAVGRGAVVFAVCAGYQVVGHRFGGVDGEPVSGLGLLDVTSGRGERRGVGELVADADPALGLPTLSGFENHQGVTTIGPGARPLATVTHGVGNGDGTEGAYAGKVLGTYMHGPALARNPGLADLLLSWAAGPLPPLDPVDEEWAARLRAERLGGVS